jgi:hypothetical protein
LEPGAEETWQITLKGPENKPAIAEVLANMYDASLDAFQNSAWNVFPLTQPILSSVDGIFILEITRGGII